jgi:hypothetical protein
MYRAVLPFIAIVLVAVACSAGSGTTADAGCPADTYCTQMGATFACTCGHGTFPACPLSGGPSCGYTASAPCMACLTGEATFCACGDGGAGELDCTVDRIATGWGCM